LVLFALHTAAQSPQPHYLINEVELTVGDNKAYALIQRVVDTRDEHRPTIYPPYTLATYNKFLFDAGPLDSLDSPYLFITESFTRTDHVPGRADRQSVEASRISGLKRAEFAVLANNLQSTSFYDDFIELYSRNYRNPISKGSDARYYFSMVDTLLFPESLQALTGTALDTVFVVYFTPRSPSDFRAMTGQLQIAARDRALVSIEAVTSDSARVAFTQDFQYVSGRWFPRNTRTTIQLSSVQINGNGVMGRGETEVSQVRWVASTEQLPRRPQADVVFAPEAMKTPDSLWSQLRPKPLDSLELQTYTAIDSLGRAEQFDRKFFLFSALRSGRWNAGPFSFDLGDFIGYNRREGFRTGFAFETRRMLHPRWFLTGDAVYGWGDTQFKGGAALAYRVRPDLEWELQAGYAQQALETGGTSWLLSTRADRQAFLRGLMVLRQDLQQRFIVRFSGYFNPRWRWATELAHFQSSPRWTPDNPSPPTTSFTQLTTEFQWRPGATAMQTQYGWVQLERTASPVQLQLQLGYAASPYVRAMFRASHRIPWRSLATTTFHGAAGFALDPPTDFHRINVAGNRGNTLQAEHAFQTLWAHERVGEAAVQAGIAHAFAPPYARWRAFPVFRMQALVDNTGEPAFFEAGWSVERILSILGAGVAVGRPVSSIPEDWRIAMGVRVFW